MEYFLYAIVQAHDIIKDLQTLEPTLNGLIDKFETFKTELAAFEMQNQGQLMNRTAIMGTNLGLVLQQKELKVEDCEKRIERLRYIISSKETDLVLIFREAISTEFHVDLREIEMQRLHRKAGDEQFEIPLSVFWRPVERNDRYEEDLWCQKYKTAVRDWELRDKHILLPKALDTNYVSTLEQHWRARDPMTTNNLRVCDFENPDPLVAFPKYASVGLF
jgi:hypothetical protein